MTTTALVPVIQAEIVDDDAAPLTKDLAKKLDQRIRRMADATCGNLLKLDELLAAAKAGDIHLALGYRSWTCYVADALGDRPEMTASARKKMVTLLAGEGMSQRAIAQATGVSKTTVKRDLDNQEVVHNGPADAAESAPRKPSPSATVTGLDDKRHPRNKPAPARRHPTAEPEWKTVTGGPCPRCPRDNCVGCAAQAQVDKDPPADPAPEDPTEADVQRVIVTLDDVIAIVATLQDNPAFTGAQLRRIVEAVHQLRNLVGC